MEPVDPKDQQVPMDEFLRRIRVVPTVTKNKFHKKLKQRSKGPVIHEEPDPTLGPWDPRDQWDDGNIPF